MANDDNGGLLAGGGNRNLEELLWTVHANLRDCEARARPHREVRLSSKGDRDLRRARRREIPAPPELSESDEEGIRHWRYCDSDSSSDEEVEQWILGEPRFAAQPRYLHHLQPPPPSHRYHQSHPPPSSSSSRHHIQTKNQISTDLYSLQPAKTQIQTPSQPSSSTRSHTHTRRSNQSPTNRKRETHKPQFHRFENAHENQFEITKTHSRFSHHNSVTKYKPPNHQFVNHQTKTNTTISLTADHENQFTKTDYQSTEIHLRPQNMASINSNSKSRPTLPGNRSPTLTDMMHFVSNWFDFEEKESAESERINISESELSKNEIGDDDFCDVLGDRVVNCVDSVQEKVEEILVDEIIGSENIAKIEEDDDFDLAREVFDKMPERDLVSWNVMISGYLRNKNLSEAWELFESMPKRAVNTFVELRRHGIEPDEFTFSSFIKGCANQAALDQGIQLAAQVIRACRIHGDKERGKIVAEKLMQLEPENSGAHVLLLNIYAKEQQWKYVKKNKLFEAMTCRNVGSWNTMITGYAQSSEITLARNLFDKSPLDTIVCDSVHFAEPVNDKIVLSVLIGQIVSNPGFGFENVKTKGVRRRQWQIAWSSSAFRWTIVLVPLWVWDELRRDFSVGVYHSHKPNMGLAPLSFN